MGNCVSPAGAPLKGDHSLVCCATAQQCCAADADVSNIIGLSVGTEGLRGLSRQSCSSSEVSPRWVASTTLDTKAPSREYFELAASAAGKASVLSPSRKSAELKMFTGEVDDADGEATTADSATPARTTPPSPSRVSTTDFQGSWLCMSVTGDMETFLQDMGLAEGPRKAASAARYGALRQVQNISQSGNFFEVENIIDKPVTMQFVVGNGVQKTPDQDGKTILIEPSWDGEVLCIVSKRESGELIANSRRYIDGEDMILELRSPSGTAVRRNFQRSLKNISDNVLR